MKSKTHILMANLLMEDLKNGNGKITLKDIGQYSVPEEISQAILNNPDYFRAGSVGPDFYPDMIVGQTIIHPKNSGDWIDYMFHQFLLISPYDTKRSQVLAFLVGFMLHYAGDLYGHEYVNRWAGGWFPSISEIISSPEKAKIIIRHILIETYMDQKIPANENLTIKIPKEFIEECFTYEDALLRYPADNNYNILNTMSELSKYVHEKSLDNSIASLDIFSYYASWDSDIRTGISEWLNTWNKIAEDFMKEDGLSKAKEDLRTWFDSYFLKMTFIPDVLIDIIQNIAQIMNYLNVFKHIKKLILDMFTDIAIQLVYAATGIRVTDIAAAINELQKMLKNPKLYLNNGILFSERNITDQLDKDFGNLGISRDTQKQTFEAFNSCLNMCKLCLLGPTNLNTIINNTEKTTISPFIIGRTIPAIQNLKITIKTSSDFLSGTDDNVYFAVLSTAGRVYETLMDKSGYNDFERGDLDSYDFVLPVKIPLDDIIAFRLRKDYISIDDDWKPAWIQITDNSTQQLVYKQDINIVIKKREPYIMKALPTEIGQDLEIDPAIISFLYSLDGQGISTENPTSDKQWANDNFIFFKDITLRQNIMTKLFHLTPEKYTQTIFNDYILAKYKTKITKIILYSDDVVYGIQLRYNEFLTPLHGTANGTMTIYNIDPDDYVVRIYGSIGKYQPLGNQDTIANLSIQTKNGKVINAGRGQGFTPSRTFHYNAENGKQISALSGRCQRKSGWTDSGLSDLYVSLYK